MISQDTFDDLKSMRTEVNRICKYYAGSASEWKPSEFKEQFENCVHELEQVFARVRLWYMSGSWLLCV